LADLPAAFQATSQAFAAGNYVGGLSDLGTGFEGLFTVLTPLVPVTAVVGPVTIGPVTVGPFTIPVPSITVGPFPIPVPPFFVGPFTIPIPPVTAGPFTVPPVTFGPFPFTVHGTPIGGIIPALVNFAPQQLADAIGAPASAAPLL
jgi:hypothetical protein